MSEFSDFDAAGIRMLAVDPRRQGLGAGRELLEHCVRRARDASRARVVLHSTPIMETARAMYLRHGFTRDESRDVFFSDEPYSETEPLHLMGYELVL